MSWDNITGDSKILPSSGGSADEIKFESGKPIRVKLLLREGEQPYSYLEHAIEAESVDGSGKTVKSFRTIRCPKTTNNPNALCPICDGQRYRRRVHNAANVWDYEQQKVQKLNAGDGIWKPIGTARKMGVSVTDVDWGLMKSGTDRNDTEYSATSLGAPMLQTPVDSAQLFDIEREYAPHTVEEMKAIVESIGIKWEEAIVPPSLTYPTLEAALAHVMPNGKYKDQSMKTIWESDQSSKGMINYLATRSDRVTLEKAAAQVILVNLGGANITGVPRYNSDGSVADVSGIPVPVATPAVTPAPAPAVATAPAVAPVGGIQVGSLAPVPIMAPAVGMPAPTNNSDARKQRIDNINNIFSTNEKFVKGGFKLIMEVMKHAGNGKQNIAEFSDAELDTLEGLCK
jgi:hypothetical protein